MKLVIMNDIKRQSLKSEIKETNRLFLDSIIKCPCKKIL